MVLRTMAAMRQQVLLPFPAEPDQPPALVIPASEELLAAIVDLLLQLLADAKEDDQHDD